MKKKGNAWYTKDGRGRVVPVGPKEWQAQELVGVASWSWIATVSTKAQAIEALKNLERGFIW